MPLPAHEAERMIALGDRRRVADVDQGDVGYQDDRREGVGRLHPPPDFEEYRGRGGVV